MSISEHWADHNRRFAGFNYVYPVISRRAKGLSIGINCTPNGVCSFDCVYCQVCRDSEKIKIKFPNAKDIVSELKELLSIYKKTKLAEHFPNVEEKDRELKDIAFSGDGEPTLYPHFAELCKLIAPLNPPKLVLITNAAQLNEGFEHLTEIWGKLDAGTDEYLRIIDRPYKKINITSIENNLKFIILKYPLRIQTMLCKILPETEIDSYIQIVQRIYETNPQNLLSVQLYSVARQTAEKDVEQLPREYLESVKKKLLEKNSKLLVEVF